MAKSVDPVDGPALPERTEFAARPMPLRRDRAPIVIGLVNNMPDAALRRTERQYRELLDAAGGVNAIAVRLFSLPGLPRGETGRAHIGQNYENFETLWNAELDGLIVTGTEPKTANLRDEPYWRHLTELIDWAEQHTTSTIWSCLAAHAAVLHIDGIGRQLLPQKLLGVFDCRRTGDHPLVFGTPSQWRLPHSRHNEVAEEALVCRGYEIVSTSREAGVDMFVKQRKSLFVFFQGHPEYDFGALAREYRRDVQRFISGRANAYPVVPQHYFDEADLEVTDLLQRPGAQERGDGMLDAVAALSPKAVLIDAWAPLAIQIYANWLSHLSLQKALPMRAERGEPAMAAAVS